MKHGAHVARHSKNKIIIDLKILVIGICYWSVNGRYIGIAP